MLEEFRKIYDNEIHPEYQKMEGCRFTFMTQSGEEENTVLCVSLWDGKKHVEEYERSGLFEKFREKTRHTFSEFYRWKMKLEGKSGPSAKSPEEMKEDTYRVVTGKSFQ
jgi:heme-degrading monooxygenase HmoA